MKLKTLVALGASHAIAGAVGFALGIYALPILIAPKSPAVSEITTLASQALYFGTFTKDLEDSDALHWGEGEVSVGLKHITFIGELSPGPDYKLYLSKEFVETEQDFNRLKDSMVQVGDVKTFDTFSVPVMPGINPADFNSVIIWCETFGQFITAAQYR